MFLDKMLHPLTLYHLNNIGEGWWLCNFYFLKIVLPNIIAYYIDLHR